MYNNERVENYRDEINLVFNFLLYWHEIWHEFNLFTVTNFGLKFEFEIDRIVDSCKNSGMIFYYK